MSLRSIARCRRGSRISSRCCCSLFASTSRGYSSCRGLPRRATGAPPWRSSPTSITCRCSRLRWRPLWAPPPSCRCPFSWRWGLHRASPRGCCSSSTSSPSSPTTKRSRRRAESRTTLSGARCCWFSPSSVLAGSPSTPGSSDAGLRASREKLLRIRPVTRARPEPKLRGIVSLGAMSRLAIALGVATLVTVAVRPALHGNTPVLLGWDAFVLCYLVIGWAVIALTDENLTRERAQRYDPGGYVIFLMVVFAASASFVAIGFIVGDIRDLPFWERAARLTLSVTALLLSWLLIHTVFAFHYARLYYFLPADRDVHHGGLKFPDDDEPDYLD